MAGASSFPRSWPRHRKLHALRGALFCLAADRQHLGESRAGVTRIDDAVVEQPRAGREHVHLAVEHARDLGPHRLQLLLRDRLAATRLTLDLSIDASDGAGISWLHRNSEVLNKELHDGRFDMTVRVDETKRDIVISRFDAVLHPV